MHFIHPSEWEFDVTQLRGILFPALSRQRVEQTPILTRMFDGLIGPRDGIWSEYGMDGTASAPRLSLMDGSSRVGVPRDR